MDETEILQRELKSDVPSYLATIAYSIVGLIVLSLLILLGWVLMRLGRSGAGAEPPAAERRPSRRPERALGVARGDRMSSLVVAHAGHWLAGIGFAAAPLTVIAGIVALVVIERRRGGRTSP